MSQPVDHGIPGDLTTADLRSSAPQPSRRHRRWPLALAAFMGLLLLGAVVETIVHSSQSGVAVAGALTGVAFGLFGLRNLPQADEMTVWFGLVRAEDVRSDEPERGGIAWRVLSGFAFVAGGAAAYFLLFPMIEPFPTAFLYGALAVLIPATLIQWCRPVRLTWRSWSPAGSQRVRRRDPQ